VQWWHRCTLQLAQQKNAQRAYHAAWVGKERPADMVCPSDLPPVVCAGAGQSLSSTVCQACPCCIVARFKCYVCSRRSLANLTSLKGHVTADKLVPTSGHTIFQEGAGRRDRGLGAQIGIPRVCTHPSQTLEFLVKVHRPQEGALHRAANMTKAQLTVEDARTRRGRPIARRLHGTLSSILLACGKRNCTRTE
jgi:hypothetical protein